MTISTIRRPGKVSAHRSPGSSSPGWTAGDAFRVRSPQGEVYGARELAHDHAVEQPFTRSLPDVALPEVATEVVVEARDSRNGWGGRTQTVSFAPGA